MMSTAQMSKEQLKEKLEALQCHFNWKLGVDSFNPPHILQKLDVEIKHTARQNQVALLGLQAYLHQLDKQSAKALQSLRDAEECNRQVEKPASTAGSLIIYGNYAWIYYLQASYREAESYLKQIQQLCPTPWDAQVLPHIQAQKGWSLLAVRARNGERARECFYMALMFEPENSYFRTGLGKALFFSWVCFWEPDIASEAISHLKSIVHKQPKNYRAKIYLAQLLKQLDEKESISLVEACVENSLDAEVLKSSALFYMTRSTERAVEILQKALEKDPGYHLLYQALAKCYRQQWLKARPEDTNKILDTAIKHLRQIVQDHPDLDLTLVKLQLAEFIGGRGMEGEEQIYKELQRQSNTLSLRCRQALNLQWGKFFLYQVKSKESAKAKFMEGYKIFVQTDQRRDCGRRLRKMARKYQDKGKTAAANAILRFLEETDRHLPAELHAPSSDDESPDHIGD